MSDYYDQTPEQRRQLRAQRNRRRQAQVRRRKLDVYKRQVHRPHEGGGQSQQVAQGA